MIFLNPADVMDTKMLTTEIAYLICDFIPIEEFGGVACVSKDALAGIKRYSTHKEIKSATLSEGGGVIFTGRRLPLVGAGKGCFVAASACVILPNSIIFIERGSIYPQAFFEADGTGMRRKRFTSMVWGGYRRISDIVSGSFRTMHQIDADSSFLHVDADKAYVRMTKKGHIRRAGDYVLSNAKCVVWA